MAVKDVYVNTAAAAGKKGNPALVHGSKLKCLATNFETVATDSAGSKYRLGLLPVNAIPVKCEINCDAIAGLDDADLGLYKPGEGGAVVDADVFMDGVDLSGGKAIGSEQNGLVTGPSIDEIGDKLWELAGLSIPRLQGYDLVLTSNNAVTAAATVAVKFWYIEG